MSSELFKSNKKDKKYMLKHDNKTTHFGQAGARDYTLMNKKGNKHYIADKSERDKVKENYRNRHRKDPINKKFTAGSLSYYLLWNKQSLSASISDYNKRFKTKIINRT